MEEQTTVLQRLGYALSFAISLIAGAMIVLDVYLQAENVAFSVTRLLKVAAVAGLIWLFGRGIRYVLAGR